MSCDVHRSTGESTYPVHLFSQHILKGREGIVLQLVMKHVRTDARIVGRLLGAVLALFIFLKEFINL